METDKIRELTTEELDGVVGGVGNNDWKKPDSDNGEAARDTMIGPFFG